LLVSGKTRILVYCDVNLLRENIDSLKKDAEALLVACKEVGLGVNSGRNGRVFMCGHNDGKAGNIKI